MNRHLKSCLPPSGQMSRNSMPYPCPITLISRQKQTNELDLSSPGKKLRETGSNDIQPAMPSDHADEAVPAAPFCRGNADAVHCHLQTGAADALSSVTSVRAREVSAYPR